MVPEVVERPGKKKHSQVLHEGARFFVPYKQVKGNSSPHHRRAEDGMNGEPPAAEGADYAGQLCVPGPHPSQQVGDEKERGTGGKALQGVKQPAWAAFMGVKQQGHDKAQKQHRVVDFSLLYVGYCTYCKDAEKQNVFHQEYLPVFLKKSPAVWPSRTRGNCLFGGCIFNSSQFSFGSIENIF